MFQFAKQRTFLAFGGLTSGLWSTGQDIAVMTPPKRAARAKPSETFDPTVADWDLIADPLRLSAEGSEILYLFGQVLAYDGAPIKDVRIDIWQCGPDGRYSEPEQPDLSRGFRGFGTFQTDSDGNYRFRTIRPVGYARRAPHINARLTPPSGRELVTELFLVDAHENDDDWNFAALGPSQQAAVSIDPVRREDGQFEAGFNFVL